MIIGIIILLIGVNTNLSYARDISVETTSTAIYNGDTLYVGGSGPGNYSTIQEALDDSSDGDTVYVYSGLYVETFDIEKSISLIGENKETTIIDGNEVYHDDVIALKADGIVVSGFTVRNAGASGDGIFINSNDNSVSNCNLLNNRENGITIREAENNSVTYCYFKDNWWGLYIYGWDVYSKNHLISHCIFDGDHLYVVLGQGIRITDCEIFNCGIGIELFYSNENIIDQCYNHDNSNGMHIIGNDNIVRNCKITNSSNDGIRAEGVNLEFLNCTIENSGADGLIFWTWTENSIVSSCRLINNGLSGVCFLGGLRNTEVSDCHFENNKYGIEMFYNNFFNRFYRNNFIGNGVHVSTDSPGSQMYFMFNFFKNNFWDDWRGIGPYHVHGFLNWDFNPAQEPYDID